MNVPPRQSGTLGGSELPKKRAWEAALRACAWIVPIIGSVVAILLLVVEHTHLADAGRQFLTSVTYTAVIGIPASIVLNWIGYHFSDRWPRGVFLLYVAGLLATAVLGTLAGGLLFQAVGLVHHGYYWSAFRRDLPISAVITLIVGISITMFETMRHKLQSATLELRTRQMEHERANKLLVEARLSSLESRIHPHFLFNTLNSISALIPSDPKRAEDTVGKLASLLRFSLNANHSSLVPLAQELKIVRDYLEIESTRFGARLRYEITVPDSLAAFQVPPLALQTLVENSVKHVVAQRTEGAALRIVGSREDERIHLDVIDDGPGFSLASVSPEHGLGNLSARLDLLFGERGQLQVTRVDGKTVARISFPAES